MISQKEIENLCNVLITSIHRKKIRGTYTIGKETTALLRSGIIVTMKKGDTVEALLDACRQFGSIVKRALPTMHVIGNLVRRVLFIIRDEFLRSRDRYVLQQQTEKRESEKNKNLSSAAATQEKSKNSSSTASGLSNSTSETSLVHQLNLANLLETSGSEQVDYTLAVSTDFKAHVIEGVNELIRELDDLRTNIGEQATEHIHTNEVILTIGHSHTVEDFLLDALKKKRNFEVIVTEHAPHYDGHEMVLRLKKEGIHCHLISDAAAYAVMPTVSKVLIGTHAVMANGGLIASTGTHLVALAAREKSVPVVVCSGLYKLTPLYPLDQDSFNDRLAPSDILGYDGALMKSVHVYNPAYDYVPPELVAMFITNNGTHNPTYIYRLLAEYYHAEDYSLDG